MQLKSDIRLYAKWSEVYTITFHTDLQDSYFWNNYEQEYTTEVIKGQGIGYSVPEIDNSSEYYLVGWSTDGTEEHMVMNADGYIDDSNEQEYIPTSDMQLYAIWKSYDAE